MKTFTYHQIINRPYGHDNGYASDSLRAELEGHAADASAFPVVNLAYTDYGGDFFDKVAIAYFIEKHPANILVEKTCYFGQNALVFGEIAATFAEETEKYPLGFEGLEDYYYAAESAEYDKAFASFMDEELRVYTFDKDAVLEWLDENKRGNCDITTQGVDYCSICWVSDLTRDGLITKTEEAE